jgi:adenylate cyclase
MAAVVGLLFVGFLDASRRSILQTAEQLRSLAAQRVDELVTLQLGSAKRAVSDVERQMRAGVVDADDEAGLERSLFVALMDSPNLSEVTFTRASDEGYDDDGALRVSRAGRFQLALVRGAAGSAGGPSTRRITERDGRWVEEQRERPAGDAFHAGAFVLTGAATDPTSSPTFVSPAARGARGRAVWSDLHWSDLGSSAPDRVAMTVQKAVFDGHDRFLGVLRVGLLTQAIDRATRIRAIEDVGADPHRIFLCDARGRLLSRVADDDHLELSGDDLRFVSPHAPAEIVAALANPLLSIVAAGQEASGRFVAGGRRYLVTFRRLAETQDWIVGVVVPEAHYTRRLEAVRDAVLFPGLAVLALALAAAVLAVGAAQRALAEVERATKSMAAFEFAAGVARSAFRDIDRVLESLERAKTALRTLGKYAPMDLVRQIYETNREPKLGGEAVDVSVMFTDIEGFTTLAETVTPTELADALGAYLAVMTAAVRETGGIVDKFIGDAVMALWNAPARVPEHARSACRAVLACEKATAALYGSAAWRGLPPLVTRFGIHCDRALVGHFGAPERMSFTALGDGVNLASRLEGLGKQYGVTRLVSEAVVTSADAEFDFRRMDRVAVKGKTHAVIVYELLGLRGTARTAAIIAYEAALDDYQGRHFDAACAKLAPHLETDRPSRVLFDRCVSFLQHPPPDDWNGIFVAVSK